MPIIPSHSLTNGLKVVVIEQPHSHRVLLSLMVRTGSRYETPAENGISHFLEHMLFRGNSSYPDTVSLNRAFEETGGMLQAHTSVEETEYSLLAHPAHLEQALENMAVFLRHPNWADFEKERRILLEELLYDYNEQGLLTDLAALASQALWPDHPLGLSVGGTPSSVEGLSLEQVGRHHARYYTPDNIVLALAGRVETGAALEMAQRHLGGWQPEASATERGFLPAPAEQPRSGNPLTPGVNTVPDPDNQFHLQFSWPAFGYNHPGELALGLLLRTLDDGSTSRLQRVIREEQALVYHIHAGNSAYQDTGSVDIATSVRAERLGDLLEELGREIRLFRERGPEQEEVEQARRRYLFDLEFDRDSLSAQVDRHAWPLLYSRPRGEEEERQMISSLGRNELSGMAASLFDPARLHLTVVGPVDDSTPALLAEKLKNF
ncbi:MAG: insulinase family protein [Deltaproteobacteria bacterium]|nr:insulinase family protein [Deltaproteobacteria bacterium]